MKIKATIANGYRWRLIIIALGCLGWAVYCVYDATIGYPEQIERYDTFLEFKENNTDWSVSWPAHAESLGWPAEEPHKREKHDILTQWLMFALTAPIGIYCLALAIIWQRRYIGVDDSTLYAYGDRSVSWDNIDRIDATRWSSKGIAKVHYKADGSEQTIVIDDWKYERYPTTDIFKTLKENVDPDKFEGLEQPAEVEPEQTPETTSSKSLDEEKSVSSPQ